MFNFDNSTVIIVFLFVGEEERNERGVCERDDGLCMQLPLGKYNEKEKQGKTLKRERFEYAYVSAEEIA